MTEDDGRVVDQGLELDRAAPERGQIPERDLGPLQLDVEAVVAVQQAQLAAIVGVGVDHVDAGVAFAGELRQQAPFDVPQLARVDEMAPGAWIAAGGEQPLLGGELGVEKVVEEGDVVVRGALLEELLAAEPGAGIPACALVRALALGPISSEAARVPGPFDMPPELDAELVGVELAGTGRGRAAVVVAIVDDLVVGDCTRESTTLSSSRNASARIEKKRPELYADSVCA